MISNPNQTGGEERSIVEMHFRAPSVSAVSTASVFSGVGWPSLPFLPEVKSHNLAFCHESEKIGTL